MNIKDAAIGGLLFALILSWLIAEDDSVRMELSPSEEEALSLCEYKLTEMEYKYTLILFEMEQINRKLDEMYK